MVFLEYYLIREVEQILPPQQMQPSTWEKIKKNVIHAAIEKISDTGYALTPGYIANISRFIFEKGGKFVAGLINKAPSDELGQYRHKEKMDDVGRITKLFGAAITSAVFYAATMVPSYMAGQSNVQKKLDQAAQEFKQQLDVKDQQIADNLAKQAVQSVPKPNTDTAVRNPASPMLRSSPEFLNLIIKKTHEKIMNTYAHPKPEWEEVLRKDVEYFKQQADKDRGGAGLWSNHWDTDGVDELTNMFERRFGINIKKYKSPATTVEP